MCNIAILFDYCTENLCNIAILFKYCTQYFSSIALKYCNNSEKYWLILWLEITIFKSEKKTEFLRTLKSKVRAKNRDYLCVESSFLRLTHKFTIIGANDFSNFQYFSAFSSNSAEVTTFAYL